MEFAATSHIGLVRKINQDGYRLGQDSAGSSLIVLADGMGGPVAGEVASALAVSKVWETLMEDGAETTETRLLRAIQDANAAIYSRSFEDAACTGMGTTIVAVVADCERIFVAHVGDSRVYLFGSSGQLTQLTHDHSYVNELVRRGQLAPEDAPFHPQRHLLMRCLGPLPDVVVECKEWPWSIGEVVLVCSDGLTSAVSDSEMQTILMQHTGQSERVDALLEAALAAGGHDNITVALLAHDGSLERGQNA